MGLIYGMVSVNLRQAITTLPSLSASNIVDFLHAQTDQTERTFYLYGAQCDKVLFDPQLPKDVEIDKLTFHQNSTAFWFDTYGTMQQLKFAPLKLEHFSTPVCLKVEHFGNGSSTPMVIRSGKHFIYRSFFEGSQSFTSLEAATQWIQHAKDNPDDLRLIF